MSAIDTMTDRDTARVAEFLQAVRTMRELQKRFFAGERAIVGAAKSAERLVDTMLEELAKEQEVMSFE